MPLISRAILAPVAPWAFDAVVCRGLAGHSKWKTIKHKKAGRDAARGKLFTKLSKAITAAAKEGTDPNSNLRLAYALALAKANFMPKDNIQNAMKRATDPKDSEILETVLYEGRGPAGTSVIVEALTGNRKRTAPVLRALFNRNGGELGVSGSVTWMFDYLAFIEVPLPEGDEEAADRVMDISIEAGAIDVEAEDKRAVVTCKPKDITIVRNAFTAAKLESSILNIDYVPQSSVDLPDPAAFQRFLEVLEDDEDVQRVFHNANLPEEDEEEEEEDDK